MEIQEALKIVRKIADGIDPFTGKSLSDYSPFNNSETVLALKCLISTIEPKQAGEMKRKETPSKAVKLWSKTEEKLVCSHYESGTSIADLAIKHGRTQGAITFRLVKFGKIQAPSQAEVPRSIPSSPKCIDCKKQIHSDQGKAIPNVVRCAICQRRYDARGPIVQNVQKGSVGSRISNKRTTTTQISIATSVRELSSNSPGLKCIDCGNKFFADPNRATLFAHLCEACYKRRIEEKKNIQVKQKIIARRIDEGIAGTREDHKKMRSWKLS